MTGSKYFHSGFADISVEGYQPGEPLDNGRYEYMSDLGGGSYGAVYRFLDQETNRLVAIKLPRPMNGDLRIAQDALDREWRAHQVIGRHRNLVEVHGVINSSLGWERPLGLVMECALHGSLREWIVTPRGSRRHRLEQGLHFISQICDVVSHLHSLGIVHGDIKPEQFVLTAPDHLKLCDLGSCWSTRSLAAPEGLPANPVIPGTPTYTAPEVAQRDSGMFVDHRSDIYSVGVLSCELVSASGQPPFNNSHGFAASELPEMAGVPRNIELAIRQCMEKI